MLNKVLADDVLMVTEGKTMLRKFVDALNYTHQYLQDMGARVAPSKSFNFASALVPGSRW